MKRFLLLLLLSGCGSQDERQASRDSAAAAGAELLNLETGEKALTPEQLEAKASGALRPILPDPASARFSNLKNGAAGAVCGLVDVKDESRYTGPKPFLVTPEGVGLISPAAEIGFGDPSDIFPDFYIRWCASPEELQTIGPRITASPDVNMQAPEVPVTTEGAAPSPPPPPPSAAEPPKVPEPAPKTADEDSFSKAVLRKGERR